MRRSGRLASAQLEEAQVVLAILGRQIALRPARLAKQLRVIAPGSLPVGHRGGLPVWWLGPRARGTLPSGRLRCPADGLLGDLARVIWRAPGGLVCSALTGQALGNLADRERAHVFGVAPEDLGLAGEVCVPPGVGDLLELWHPIGLGHERRQPCRAAAEVDQARLALVVGRADE